MFGKVQEESYSIFDLSFDNGLLNGVKGDNSFDNVISHNDRKNKGIIGVRNNTHQFENDSNRDTISPSLLTSLLLSATRDPSSPLNLAQSNKNNDPWGTKSFTASKVDDSDIEQLQKLRSSAFSSNNFSQNQFDQLKQLQQLSFNEKQQLAASLISGTNDIPTTSDLAYRQEQQQKFNNHSNSNQTSFMPFDNQDDKSSSSASSSSSSSSDSFVSSGTNAKVNTSRYKTEMCRPFQENGSCKYGEKCQFAHGLSELRTVTRHPKYKTDLCRTYHASGFCPYGPRCHFVHNLEEAGSKQLPVNVILRPGQSSSPTSSSPPSNNTTTDNSQADGAMRPLPMFSPKRNVAPPKQNNGEHGCKNIPYNFQLKLNTANTSQNYMNVSSGGGSVASLSPATPIALDEVCSPSFTNGNSRSPGRLPVFSTLHQ
jgi:hypothetical protein